MEDSRIETGNIEGVGIAIGTGARVVIKGDVHYYPIRLRAPLRQIFDPLIEERTLHFGGRSELMRELATVCTQTDGGYFVITAPAGFGKTSVMAALVHRTPEAFAYHFFAPLYGPGTLEEGFFLRNVIEQLAEWHAETDPLPDEQQINELRALYQRLIRTPLKYPRTLVLDGLDEVTQWSLAPYLSARLPDGLHVILSVRDVGQDWLSEYGLPQTQTGGLTLSGLRREDVAEVLIAAGGPASGVAASQEALRELMKVAAYEVDPARGADPFYVRLLADDLAAGHLNSSQLGAQPTGLSDYLHKWWEQLATTADVQPIADLLSTLTVTLGPISRADLEALNPSLVHPIRRNYFDDVVGQVRRWVTCGRDGLALVHPRLRRFMLTELRTDHQCERVLAYCERWPEHGSAYAMRYYVQHLEADGQVEALHRLLAMETDDGFGAWYEAKNARGDVGSYMADVSRAWALADAAGAHSVLPATEGDGSLALQCRYAVAISSLNSLTSHITPELILELVVRGIWSSAQGLAYVQRMTDTNQRTLSIAALSPRLAEPRRTEVLERAAKEAAWLDPSERSNALAALLPNLSGPTQASVFRKICSEIDWLRKDSIFRGDADALAQKLAASSSHLSDELRREAIELALDVAMMEVADSGRAETLLATLPGLHGREREVALTRALALVAGHNVSTEASVLAALAPELSASLRREAMGRVVGLAVAPETGAWDVPELAKAASRLLIDSDEDERREYLAPFVRLYPLVDHPLTRLQAISALIPCLPDDLQAEALDEAFALLRSADWRLRGGGAEEIAESIQILAPYVPKSRAHKLLKYVKKNLYEFDDGRPATLAAVAALLDEPLRERTYSTSIRNAQSSEYAGQRAEALTVLAPRLPEPFRAQALTIAVHNAVTDDNFFQRISSLSELAPLLSDALLRQCLDLLPGIDDEFVRAKATIALLGEIPESSRGFLGDLAVKAAKSLEESRERLECLAALAPILPQSTRGSAMGAAVQAAVEVAGTAAADALITLAPLLRHSMMPEVMTIAGTVDDSATLAALAEVLPDPWATDVGRMAEEALQVAIEKANRAQVQKLVYPCHSDDLPKRKAMPDVLGRAHALVQLLSEMPPAMRHLIVGPALSATQELGPTPKKADLLGVIAGYLTGDAREQIANDALSIVLLMSDAPGKNLDYLGRAALVRVTPLLSTENSSVAIESLLVAAFGTETAGDRVDAFADIMHLLPEKERKSAMDDVLATLPKIEDANRRLRAALRVAQANAGSRKEVLTDAIGVARRLSEADWSETSVSTCAEILKHLKVSQRSELIEIMLSAALNRPQFEPRLFFGAVAQAAIDLDRQSRYTVWTRMLHRLSELPRNEFVGLLAELAPLIKKTGSERDVAAVANEIVRGGCWWP